MEKKEFMGNRKKKIKIKIKKREGKNEKKRKGNKTVRRVFQVSDVCSLLSVIWGTLM